MAIWRQQSLLVAALGGAGLFSALPAEAQESAPAESAPAESAAAAAERLDEETAGEATTATTEDPFGAGRPAATRGQRRSLLSPQEDGWHLEFNGFFRAPMRLGIGARGEPAEGQSETTFHAPLIPDDQYLSWQYSRQNPRDWAELVFSYGNEVARGVVGLQAYQFTNAAWNDVEAQFGIAQGYIELTPRLGRGRHFWLKAGSEWDAYGEAGVYDAGQYDTYLFGRTSVMGETAHYDITLGEFTYGLEQGFGTRRPFPGSENTSRFTLLHHEHLTLAWKHKVQLGLHYLYSWASEEPRPGASSKVAVEPPDGSLGVLGVGLRADGDRWGHLFLGYSVVNAKSALTVGPAIEVIHAQGGGEEDTGFVAQYLVARGKEGDTPADKVGTGSVSSVAVEWDFSAKALLTGEEPDEEQRDLVASLYGMVNTVSSYDPDADGVVKLKYGTDLLLNWLPWLGFGFRYDRLQPNSEIAEQSFSILSPRVVLRSKWASHEELSLQYSRYVYNQRECATDTEGLKKDPYHLLCVQTPSSPASADAFGAVADEEAGIRGAPSKRPDVNVVTLTASMWW